MPKKSYKSRAERINNYGNKGNKGGLDSEISAQQAEVDSLQTAFDAAKKREADAISAVQQYTGNDIYYTEEGQAADKELTDATAARQATEEELETAKRTLDGMKDAQSTANTPAATTTTAKAPAKPRLTKAQKTFNDVQSYVQKQTGVDISKYHDPQYDFRGGIVIDWKRMTHNERTAVETALTVSYGGKYTMSDHGAWGKWIKKK